MQIWKSAKIFVFIWKYYVEDVTLKLLLLFKICAREVCEKFCIVVPLRIVLFHRKVMYHSQDIQVFVFLNILWFTKSIMTSWWLLLVHKTVHFWVHILNCNSLSHQTWSINKWKYCKNFSGIFWTIWRTGAKLQVLFNLGICSNYSVTNYVKIPMCLFIYLFFWNWKKWTFKNCKW